VAGDRVHNVGGRQYMSVNDMVLNFSAPLPPSQVSNSGTIVVVLFTAGTPVEDGQRSVQALSLLQCKRCYYFLLHLVFPLSLHRVFPLAAGSRAVAAVPACRKSVSTCCASVFCR
jgi:hypothetical protein